MACQRLALCMIFLLAGNEVLAARQKSQREMLVREINGFGEGMQDALRTNDGLHSTSADELTSTAACDKDIIVESNGERHVVLAQTYVANDVVVLQKHTPTCNMTYSVVCSKDQSAVRKDDSCDGGRQVKSVTRYFNAFHWWRDTEIKTSKGETSITFSDIVGWPKITSGKVSFTPSGSSCSEVSIAMASQASELESMLEQDRVRNFRKVSSALRDYANKRREMMAMGCPAEMVDQSQGDIIEYMSAYFMKHQGGRDAPMAEARFSAALGRIRSVASPTKEDFAEVVALMRFGSCPEAEETAEETPEETRASTDSLSRLVDEVDESEEGQLEEDLQTCFTEENCDAIDRKLSDASSLMQQGENSSALMQTTGIISFLANFVLFLCLLVLLVLFWPFVLLVLVVWLLVMLVMLPFALLAGPVVVWEEQEYHLGAFDYLVDAYCRPAIDALRGYPLRQTAQGIKPAKPAPPVKRYVTFRGAPLVDDRSGWPIAAFDGEDGGLVMPLIGLPRPAE